MQRNSISSKKKLLSNTIMLYLLTFSTYLFAFITIPYQTRVLGPEVFGVVGLAMAVMIFVQLFIDFGFLLYATAEVSKHRKDTKTIISIYSSVTWAKVGLSILALIALIMASLIFETIANNMLFYILFTFATIFAAMLPDFIYRGMEKMAPITIRTVIVRLFFVLMIFIFLKGPEDILVIPTLLLIGNLSALIFVFNDVKNRFGIQLIKPALRDIKHVTAKSSHYFYSRIATAVYGAGNTIVLGAFVPGVSVGYYVAVDKLISASKSLMSPIADSAYPHMIKTKDYALIRKLLLFAMPIIITLCIIAFILAEQICVFLFGKEYADAAPILQIMLPIVAFTLPTYLLGFPTLGAMGLSKHANNSIIFASVIQLIMVVLLIATNNITVITIAITATISEGLALLYRILAIYLNKNKLMVN